MHHRAKPDRCGGVQAGPAGGVLLIAGLAFICNWRTRSAATGFGLAIFLLVLFLYVPIVIAKPSAIGSGLNALADTLLFSGTMLCFAGSQRDEKLGHVFRRLKGFRRSFSRFEKLDLVFLAFIDFAFIIEALR